MFEHLDCVKPQWLWFNEDADSSLRMKLFVYLSLSNCKNCWDMEPNFYL